MLTQNTSNNKDQEAFFFINFKCARCFKKKLSGKPINQNQIFSSGPLPPCQPVHMGARYKKTLGEPCVEVWPRPAKLSNKQFTKKLSTGLLWWRLLAEIAARWRYRLPIKNLTSHYESPFCVSFTFSIDQEACRRLYWAKKILSSLLTFMVILLYTTGLVLNISMLKKCNCNSTFTFQP